MTEMRHIGRETRRILGEDILTGKAMYTGDFHPANMHYGKILHSPHPFARVRGIDYSRAMALPGVKCVVTHDDIDPDLSINNGYTPPRHPNVLDEYVRFVGDAVALVVAETEDIAEEACKLIDVDYEVLTPVFNIDDALKPDAPQLYKVFPGNIAPHKQNLNFETGDIEKGFAEADYVVDIETGMDNGQNPMPLEAPVIIAEWKNDTLDLIASCAAPAYCQQNVASSMNLRYEQVRIMAPAVGGSFGSKLYCGNVQVLVLAGLMAMKAHVPVMLRYTREEHLSFHQNRMSTKAHIKLGLKKDATVTAVEMRQYSDAGYCASTQEFMMAVGTNSLIHLTKTENKKYDGDVVVTNHMCSGSFRGYGYLESTTLLARAIFNGCEKLGIDPVEYLRKNALTRGEHFYNANATPHCDQVNAVFDWSRVVEESAKAFGWQDKWKGWGVPTWTSPDGRYARGVGVFSAGHADTGGKPSNASVTLTGLGGVYVNTVMVDFGAGTREVMQKIAAEALNMPLENVRLSPADTQAAPPDFGSTGSRSTYCGGICVKRACDDILRQIGERAEAKLGIPAAEVRFGDGFVWQEGNPDKKWPLFPFIMGKVDGITGVGHHNGVENSTIYQIQFVEIEVDRELGTIKVIDHFSGADAGRIINPLAAKNQMESFFAGIDIACMEETVYDPHDYRVLNANNIDYKMRLFNEVPHHSDLVLESCKSVDSPYPFGANGIGEPTIAPGGPAITMALYNACGIMLESYPYTPGKVLAALKEKEERA